MRQWTYYLLFAFVFFIPAENIVIFSGFGTMSKLAGVLAFGMGALAVLFTQIRSRVRPFHLLALLFVLWGFLTYWWSLDPRRTVVEMVTLAQILLMLALITEFAIEENRQLGLMQAYVLGAGLTAVVTVYALLSGQGMEGRGIDRFGAFGFDPNRTALMVALGLPMAWYLAGRTRLRLLEWINRLYVPVAMLAIFSTASRSGFLAMTVALFFIPLSSRGYSTQKKVTAIGLFLVGSLVAVSLAPKDALDRLARGQQEIQAALDGDPDAGSHRIGVWMSGVQAFYDRPFFGSGVGAFPKAMMPHYTAVDHALEDAKPAHNTYLSVLVEQGVVGFLFFAALLAYLVLMAWRLPPEERLLFLSLLGVWAISNMFITQTEKKHTWLIFALVAMHGHLFETYRQAWMGRVRQRVARPVPPAMTEGA